MEYIFLQFKFKIVWQWMGWSKDERRIYSHFLSFFFYFLRNFIRFLKAWKYFWNCFLCDKIPRGGRVEVSCLLLFILFVDFYIDVFLEYYHCNNLSWYVLLVTRICCPRVQKIFQTWQIFSENNCSFGLFYNALRSNFCPLALE